MMTPTTQVRIVYYATVKIDHKLVTAARRTPIIPTLAKYFEYKSKLLAMPRKYNIHGLRWELA